MVPVSTIYVLGFPLEVTHRDLKNFCRFLPGFEGGHVPPCPAGQPPALFVKFVDRNHAVAAIQTIHGQPFDMDEPHLVLKAELARRDFEVNQPGPGAAVAQNPLKRALPPLQQTMSLEDDITTVTVLGTRDKGFTLASLQEWFGSLPGCVAIQVNEKIDGIFARFASKLEAENAIQEAAAQGLGAEWARRNLDATAPPPAATHAPEPVPVQSVGQVFSGRGYAAAQPPAKFPHVVEGGELTTITVLAMRDKGIRQDELDAWFRTCRGFQGLTINTKLDGMFVKFATGADAEKAMQEANSRQYRAEWARRNLDIGEAPAPPVSAQAQTWSKPWSGGGNQSSGEINTVTIMGITEKGLSRDELQEWFAQRPGYQMLKVNDRIDGLFVRFGSNAEAAQAMSDAHDLQMKVEWARRNLD